MAGAIRSGGLGGGRPASGMAGAIRSGGLGGGRLALRGLGGGFFGLGGGFFGLGGGGLRRGGGRASCRLLLLLLLLLPQPLTTTGSSSPPLVQSSPAPELRYSRPLRVVTQVKVVASAVGSTSVAAVAGSQDPAEGGLHR
jgi:hypothetical protein